MVRSRLSVTIAALALSMLCAACVANTGGAKTNLGVTAEGDGPGPGLAPADDAIVAEATKPGEAPKAGEVQVAAAQPGIEMDPGTAKAADPKLESKAKPLVPGVPVKLEPVSRIAANAAQPRLGSAIYRCGGGKTMTIDNRRSMVNIIDPDGEVMALPAAPANQTSRYGKQPVALVLDGNEALYVKPRKSPFTCKR